MRGGYLDLNHLVAGFFTYVLLVAQALLDFFILNFRYVEDQDYEAEDGNDDGLE